jgi:methionyl-tRNA formyltransferase
MPSDPVVVFMGTPDFAVPTLKALHRSAFDLRMVVTQPDRPKGRGRKLAPPPVKLAAEAMDCRIVQPPDIRETGFCDQLRSLAPDFLVVAAFGQILPRSVLEIPRYGPINVHASILPKYRGPAPIQWALIRGERVTGVTTILMDHGVDTGDMLLTAETAIRAEDNAASLHDRLADMGAEVLVKTLLGLVDGSIHPIAQNHALATYAPMLTKKSGRVDWNKPAQEIDALIRATTPWPGAYCRYQNHRLKIHKAKVIQDSVREAPGTVVAGFPDELRIATAEGVLLIQEIQSASGRRMSIKNFLHGTPIPPGKKFN